MKPNLHLLGLIVLFFQFSFLSIGQGLILDPISYDTTPRLPLYQGEKGASALPKKVSLRPKYCPNPADQGNVNSCVAFSCAYGAYTIVQAKNNSWSNVVATQNAFSAAYLFKQLGKQGGMNIPTALEFMKNSGICRAETFPYTYITNQTKLDPNVLNAALQKAMGEAPKFKITSHPAINKDINSIKQALSLGYPVIFGAIVEFKFKELGKVTWWNPEARLSMNHAMVIVGYDEEDNSFEIMNSYGVNWGNGGFIKIKQNDLINKVFKEAYSINYPQGNRGMGAEEDTPMINTEQRETVASFYLKNLIEKHKNISNSDKGGTEGGDSSVFEPTRVFYNPQKQAYETNRRDWRVNEVFQFIASNIPNGKYLYVFSQDATHKLTVHWPPDARWAETDERTSDHYAPNFGKKPVSALILSPKTILTIPAPDEGLQISHKGEDCLIVLVADQPLSDFKQRFDKFKAATGVYSARLKAVFGDVLIPQNRIVYMKNEMTVRRFSHEPNGWVVPMILSVNAE